MTKQSALRHAPSLCFGQVLHRRLQPVKNRFAYGVYFLRLPMRTLREQPSALSHQSCLLSHNRFNCLSFYDADHGIAEKSGLAWLEELLQQQGVQDADGEIWLHTFPRVLGYVFNPVSFWFCERADGSLRAIVCEVNNTFGERHAYLLDDVTKLSWGRESSASKVFHVSPFNQVVGHYRFRFLQAADKKQYLSRIDYDTPSGAVLETSISGKAQRLTTLAIIKALLTYPFMTYGVMLKIHWQALRLWWKRLPFYTKPIPPLDHLSK